MIIEEEVARMPSHAGLMSAGGHAVCYTEMRATPMSRPESALTVQAEPAYLLCSATGLK